jgi:hypothetical protein
MLKKGKQGRNEKKKELEGQSNKQFFFISNNQVLL